jgi:hypothetical protein
VVVVAATVGNALLILLLPLCVSNVAIHMLGLFTQSELTTLRPFVHWDAYWQAKQFYPPITEGGAEQPKEFWLLEDGGNGGGDGENTDVAAAYQAAMQRLVCSPRLRNAAYQLLKRENGTTDNTCASADGSSETCPDADVVSSVCVVLNRVSGKSVLSHLSSRDPTPSVHCTANSQATATPV